MKRALNKTIAAVLPLILALIAYSPAFPEERLQKLFGDAVSSNNVLIVHTSLRTENGREKPAIEKMRIQRGRARLTQEQALGERDPSQYQIEIMDSSGRPLFRENFQYPRFRTVPPAPPSTSKETTQPQPSQIPVETPEASFVLPFLYKASSVRISREGDQGPAASMSMLNASASEIIRTETEPLPPPAQEGKFHILIMASGYSSADMPLFQSRAKEIKTYLLSKEPFLSKSSSVDIHIHENTLDLGCYCGCFGIDRLSCCTDNLVISAAAASGYYYDEIIIVYNTATYCGGGYRDYSKTEYQTSGYNTYTMVYAGEWSSPMALHEFGHSFGDLCDEYSYGTEGYTYYDCANCRPDCQEFGSLAKACYQGCDAESAYFRPDESIMLSLGNEYYNNVSIRNSLLSRMSYYVPDQDKTVSIADFTPGSGKAGTKVTITGKNFSSKKEGNIVKFSGKTAKVLSVKNNGTILNVTVPGGAKTGYITVTVGKLTGKSKKKFTVIT